LYCILHSNIGVHTKVVIVVQEIGYALLISHAQNFTDFLPLRFFSTGFQATAFKEIRSTELKIPVDWIHDDLLVHLISLLGYSPFNMGFHQQKDVYIILNNVYNRQNTGPFLANLPSRV
jgi:hypothetical protein